MHVRWVGLLFLLSLWGAEMRAQAQTGPLPRTDRSFDLQLFHPAVGARSFITLDSAEVLEHRLMHFGLVMNYQREPFSYSLRSADATTVNSKTIAPVRDLATAELVAAVGLFNRFEIGAALPLSVSWEDDRIDAYGRLSGGAATSVVGLGDLRVEGKGELVGFGTDRAFLLSLSAGGTLPTGDNSAFFGEKTVTGRLRALLEYQRGEWLRALAMLGGLFREKSVFLGSPESHAALYGLAAEVKPTEQIGVLAEVTGRVASKYYDTNPAEFDAAMRFYFPPMLNLLMGAGFGLNHGIGSPLVRAYVGLGYAPDYRDRDHDGIPDVYDRCPDEPEDFDGFQDADGCPDPDNDGDGIPDVLDKCPNEPEDFDGFEDNDGCPDPDNDHDGIPDVKDKCPNQPETYNNFKDDDGCPDGPPLVALGETDDRVFMVEHINFFPGPGGKPQLTTNSHMLVGLVARVLKAHVELAKVRIDVHGKDVSKEVTQERGEVVLKALVRNGVGAQLLKVAGLGPGPNRVEFIIESRAKPRHNLTPMPGVVPADGASGAPPPPAVVPSEVPTPPEAVPQDVPAAPDGVPSDAPTVPVSPPPDSPQPPAPAPTEEAQ